MRGKKAKALRRIAKVLYLEYYKSLLPKQEHNKFTVEMAIEYSPTMWKRVCRKVKKNPAVKLENLV